MSNNNGNGGRIIRPGQGKPARVRPEDLLELIANVDNRVSGLEIVLLDISKRLVAVENFLGIDTEEQQDTIN